MSGFEYYILWMYLLLMTWLLDVYVISVENYLCMSAENYLKT